MCGIAGFVQASGGVGARTIEPMLATLTHRGPDATGYFARPHAVIGQTRLSIIDVGGGDPPLTSEDESIGSVLNGEVYNFREIQKDLLQQGHRLQSQCDTEVIAHLAESLDPVELCRRLDGMFAFAVWNETGDQLILGRDRFGKKPLYYWYGNGTLVFASEIKALFAHSAVPRDLNTEAIPAYLLFGYVPTPDTFFAGIHSVPPGHVLTCRPGAAPKLARYWAPPSDERVADLADVPLDVQAAEIRRLLLGAVERRLIADVPLGAFLSGGIDSAAVVGLMAQLSEEPVRTFSIGFEDSDGFDERPFSRLVARRFSTDHTEFVVRPDAVGLLERLVWHHDQPFGDSSAIPTYLLAEATRAEVTVALSGDGGDELFAGYARFPAAVALDRYKRIPRVLRRPTEAVLKTLPRGGFLGQARRFVSRAEMDPAAAFMSWITYSPDEVSGALALQGPTTAASGYRARWDATKGDPYLHRLLQLNAESYLLDDLLPKVDRMSMAHGLEVRCPFLDTTLYEFSRRLPPRAFVRGTQTKRVLRHALRDLLPDEVIERPKRGFAVPLSRWLRTDLKATIASHLGPNARVRHYVRTEALDEVVARHHSGAANYPDLLWALLTLEAFLRKEQW